jgi:virginiamycin B lyase
MKIPRLFAALTAVVATAATHAATITVVDVDGKPVATAMVREVVAEPRKRDTSDGDYPMPGKVNGVDTDITRFTDAAGRATWVDRGVAVKYLIRKPGYQDASVTAAPGRAALGVTLARETDPAKLADAKPANVWLGALDLGDDAGKRHFMLQCGFCHQQGNAFLRRERTSNEWRDAIHRMVRYGSRLATAGQKALPDMLVAGWRKLREHPELLAEPAPWDPVLAGTVITEWPIGDAMSQTHD